MTAEVAAVEEGCSCKEGERLRQWRGGGGDEGTVDTAEVEGRDDHAREERPCGSGGEGWR